MDSDDRRSDGNNEPDKGNGASVKSAVERKGIQTQPTRYSARLWNKYFLPLQVFNNDLLREKILGYAVLSETKQKAIYSLRLVAKSWNQTIIKLFYKNREPLFHLNPVYAPLFHRISSDNLEGKVQRFCVKFASSTLINSCIPPFHLSIPADFSPNLVTELDNLLAHCGEGLIQLKIWMTQKVLQKGSIFKSEFPAWPIIRLRKLDIRILLTQETVTANNRQENGQAANDSVDLYLLKAVPRDAINLTDISIHLTSYESTVIGPSIFESVTFPVSLTIMTLGGNVRAEDLETLSSKFIPNLSSLALYLTDYRSLGDGLLFRILDNFRASLQMLSIAVHSNLDPSPNGALIRFPVMERLEELSIESLEPSPDSALNSLERSLPKLRTLHLYNLTEDALRKWIGSSKFLLVTTLYFYLAQSNQLEQPNLVNGLTMETMQNVYLACPNLRKLELGFPGNDTSGLEYIFKEMTQLTDLKLYWDKGTIEVNLVDFWDSVLTGLPLESVARLKDSPDLWEKIEVEEEQVGVSIKNLKELTSLSLSENRPVLRPVLDNPRIPPADINISDMTFRFALLQIPKLKTLLLKGGLKASAEMTQEWRMAGRVLECSK